MAVGSSASRAAFCADRWAEAFIASCSDDVDAAFESLKVMAKVLQTLCLKARITGTDDALRVEKMARAAMKKTAADSPGTEIACRTLVLLIRRGLFQRSQALIEEIGIALDRRNGVLAATLETAAPLPASFRKNLEQSIKETAKAHEIRLTEKIAPELLGGYKLRVGTRVIDASVASFLQNMAKQCTELLPNREPRSASQKGSG
ncbi:MAG: F0F1 ATP synthase subunit delta [Treponema sp.]|jgi:F-type H+-transporting ATPase subunit delta|nr:F0F1 ATP synthase subunit delta [Treponema sp.]